MAKPLPVDNSFYTKIIFYIANGVESPQELCKKFLEDYNEYIDSNNMYDDLSVLRKLGFIKNKRQKSLAGSTTSKQFIDYEGILKYMFNHYFKSKLVNEYRNKSGIYKNPIIKNMLYKYLLRCSKLAKIENLNELFKDFIFGVGWKFHENSQSKKEGKGTDIDFFEGLCFIYMFKIIVNEYRMIVIDSYHELKKIKLSN